MVTLRPAAAIAPRHASQSPGPAAPSVRQERVGAFRAEAAATAADGPNVLMRALQAVRDGIRWVLLGPMVSEFRSRRVIDDPDTRWASASEVREAKARLAGNAGAEASALAKLGVRKAAYEAIAGTLSGDPMAREALQRMLLDGRLTGQRDLRDSGDLLDHLDRLQAGPLAAGIVRSDLLANLVEEADNPTKLAQEARGTCVATTSTIVLARKNPAEYARLVAELASPGGQAVTAGGRSIRRAADWAVEDDGNRTPSVRLLQPALMELGNGIWGYDNRKDRHTVGPVPVLPGGLGTFGADKVLEALTGDRYRVLPVINRLTRNWAYAKVEAATQAGKAVPVGVMWSGGGHKILVESIAQGQVTFTNPWGQRETMSVAEFKQNLMDANLPA